MFQLTTQELTQWKSQNATSNKETMGLRKLPYVFTEQGIAMLSSVLNSETAIEVNIQIIRIFTRLREAFLTQKDILDKMEQLERIVHKQSRMSDKLESEIQTIFKALKQLLHPDNKREPIGFKLSGIKKNPDA